MTFPTYFEAFDAKAMLADYPVGDAFVARYTAMSRDELRAIQERQFARLMMRGWEVPFYRRLWGARGIEPGDIRGLDDIVKLPVYDKSDLMASVATHPPYRRFCGPGRPGDALAVDLPHHQRHHRPAAAAAVRAEGARDRQPAGRADVPLAGAAARRRGPVGLWPRHDQRRALYPRGGDAFHQCDVPVGGDGHRDAQRRSRYS